jgi:hypothetical protein
MGVLLVSHACLIGLFGGDLLMLDFGEFCDKFATISITQIHILFFLVIMGEFPCVDCNVLF